MTLRTGILASAAVLAAMSAACGAAGEGGMSARPPTPDPASQSSGISDIPAPTLAEPDPDQPTPSDYIAGDTIAGRVTKGGTGPCVEIVTDDGDVYSLHNAGGLALEEGSYVTAKLAPQRARIYCGPGRQYALVSMTWQ